MEKIAAQLSPESSNPSSIHHNDNSSSLHHTSTPVPSSTQPLHYKQQLSKENQGHYMISHTSTLMAPPPPSTDVSYNQWPYSTMYHQMASYNMMASHHYNQHDTYHHPLACTSNSNNSNNSTTGCIVSNLHPAQSPPNSSNIQDLAEDRKPTLSSVSDISPTNVRNSTEHQISLTTNHLGINNSNLDDRKPMSILEPLITINTTPSSLSSDMNSAERNEMEKEKDGHQSYCIENSLKALEKKQQIKNCCICHTFVSK